MEEKNDASVSADLVDKSDQSRRAIDDSQMIERFGPAISNLLEESSIRHLWRLAFLVNFFIGPFYVALGKRYDISRPEAQILYSLMQRDTLLAQDICLVTGAPANSIGRAVLLLINKGYVKRATSVNDKRAKSLRLTKSGRALMTGLVPKYAHRQDLMRAALSQKELATFDRLLKKMVFAMPDWVDSELP